MDERADRVAAHQTEQPQDQQNDGDGVEHGPSPLIQAMQGMNRPACREPISSVAVAIAEYPARLQETSRVINWVCRILGAATECSAVGAP
jgi:hypothetical protein